MPELSAEEKLRVICEETVSGNGFLLIDFRIRKQKIHTSVELFVDKKEALTLDDCAALSRILGQKLEDADIGLENYRLDVSSPGVDRKLVFLDQYYKHTGRTFDITYKDESGNEVNLKASLLRIENEMPVFQTVKGVELIVPFNAITAAQVLVRFS